ncbi:MAG: Rne/Rng family ribonuclease [Cyanobacteria bacterium REEB65]|nr:Rne/Rng family ribonuclease [Cyanobacteria bacterium REEB65]
MLKEHRPRRGGLEQAPPPANQKEIVICEENDLAVVFEEGRACEFILRSGDQLVGDIILGRVESVVPAIEAAFINIGHDKNGFIHVADLPCSPVAKKKGKNPTVRSGDKLIVQIAKAPTGTKGARLTGRISVPGRYLVFVPHDNRVCISRRIVDSKERERLRRIAFNLKDPGHGLIVRTEAIGASEDELRRDIDELIDRWAEILHVAQVKHAPALLHRDQDLMTRVLRDALSAETQKIILDSEEGLQKAADLLSSWMPDMVKNLHLHRSKESVMNYYKINAELEAALKPAIRLPSGGSIVIEHTEALTCIDVNSGKLTQSKSLQDTVLRTNLEAATEIARQLRLRDIGGVVIIDFISMDFPADRQKVIRHFEEALRPDKSRPQITSQFSEHGLLEVARRRQGQSLLEQLTKPCPHCNGVGRLRNEVFGTDLTTGHAISESASDAPEAIVEELIEEPIAGPEMLDSEVEPGAANRRPRAPQVAAARMSEFGEEEPTEGASELGFFEANGEQRRRRRRRRRGRGGRPEGFGGPTESFGIRATPPTGNLEFEASEEDIAAYSRDAESLEPGQPSLEHGDGDARRRRRRRRGRGGRDRNEGMPVSGFATRPAEIRSEPAQMGFARPTDRPAAATARSGFGRPAPAWQDRTAPVAQASAPPERVTEIVPLQSVPQPLEADAAKRSSRNAPPLRPIVGPVEKTAPYTPKPASVRPRMEIREVAPGVMQLVPVEGAAADTTAPKEPAKRPAARRTSRPKAVASDEPVDEPSEAIDPTAKPTRRRAPAKSKATSTRSRKPAQD